MTMTEEEKAIHSWPSDTVEQRQAQVDALLALAENPNSPYDGHHGTDRSADSLEYLRATNPVEYERILRKMGASS